MNVAENLLRHAVGRRCHADHVVAHTAVRADFFGGGKCPLEQRVEPSADTVLRFGHTHGFFHLPQNLRFAQNHAVQTAGHAEGMVDGLAAAEGVKIWADFRFGDIVIMREPFDNRIGIAHAIQFGAVAGR